MDSIPSTFPDDGGRKFSMPRVSRGPLKGVANRQRTTVLGTVEAFPTKRLAEREAASFLARVNRLDYRPVKRAMLAEFAETWKKQVLGLYKPTTVKVMESHVRFHLVPAFGRMRLDEIGQEQVQAFVGKVVISEWTTGFSFLVHTRCQTCCLTNSWAGAFTAQQSTTRSACGGWSDPKHHFGHRTMSKSGVAPANTVFCPRPN